MSGETSKGSTSARKKAMGSAGKPGGVRKDEMN